MREKLQMEHSIEADRVAQLRIIEIETAIEKHGPDYVREKIDMCAKVGAGFGFLKNAIDQDWKPRAAY